MRTNLNMKEPYVSISCITYNHANYIKEAIEGFLMQQTSFSFEILIHDDASVDGTSEIIKEYEMKYPELIKPIYETENQWIKGRRGSPFFNFPRAKGKYIAMCEGDDYWTDPFKLQKQVDFLEKNNEYSMCFHNSHRKYEIECIKEPHILVESRDYNSDELLLKWVIPTASMVFRKECISNLLLDNRLEGGDRALSLACAETGKIRGMIDYMSTYRIQPNSITFMRIKDGVELYKRYIKHFKYIKHNFPKVTSKAANIKISETYITIFLYYYKDWKLIGLKYLLMALYYRPKLIYKAFIKILNKIHI